MDVKGKRIFVQKYHCCQLSKILRGRSFKTIFCKYFMVIINIYMCNSYSNNNTTNNNT